MTAQTQLPATIERSPVVSGATPQALVPTSLAGVWKLSEIIAESGMAPKDMNTPQKISVAIMHGMEVGLTPMAALQSIAVVNGRPTIWGDGAIGLIRASGLLESINERIDGDGDAMTARCEVKRKGEKDIKKGEFSVADAKKAQLWSKSGPWTQYPKRMLQMRARAFALRDAFADVLRGLAIREEMEDVERDLRDVTPPPAPRAGTRNAEPPAAPKGDAAATRQTASTIEHETDGAPQPTSQDAGASDTSAPQPQEAPASDAIDDAQDVFDPQSVLTQIQEQCATARQSSDVDEIRALFAEDIEQLSRSDKETAEYYLEEALKRVAPAEKTVEQTQDADPPPPPAQTKKRTKQAETAPAGQEGTDDDLGPPAAPKAPAPSADPFAVPEKFADVHAYRGWIQIMVQSTSSQEQASRIRAGWQATREVRDELQISMPTRKELQALITPILEKWGA